MRPRAPCRLLVVIELAVLGAVLVACGDGGRAATADRSSPLRAGWTTYRDVARGFSVAFPSGWQRARARLTPFLADPREVLALGTGRLSRQSADGCAHMPRAAVQALRTGDALLTLMERRRPGRGYLARPAHFRLVTSTRATGLECVPSDRGRRVWWIPFRDRRRAFYALVAVGPNTSRARLAQAERVLDSLRFAARPGVAARDGAG